MEGKRTPKGGMRPNEDVQGLFRLRPHACFPAWDKGIVWTIDISNPLRKLPVRPRRTARDARIDRREMQYLYNDGDLYYFMDMESFEQLPLNADKLSANFKFVKENDMCKIASYNGNVFAVEPPMFVTLEVTATEPGVRGDTATGSTKPATVETGAEVKVPLFINQGDVIRIDTRTGEYLERA